MNAFVSSFKKTNQPHSLFLPTKEKIKSQAEGKWEKWKIVGLGVGRKREEDGRCMHRVSIRNQSLRSETQRAWKAKGR